jgi:multiple sugar transport system ATP-binding protein
MNFFNAKLVRADGGMAVKSSSFTVPVPSNRQDQYASYLDKDIIFGIRPDDIHDPDFAPPGIVAAPVEMKVDVTELMGNEIFVFMVTGEDQFVGRFDPRTSYSHGGQGKAVFNMANMHIFDTSGLQETIA